jgi:hypothetical protein
MVGLYIYATYFHTQEHSGHRTLYFTHGVLQRDVSIGNILISKVGDKIGGLVNDLDYAKQTEAFKKPLLQGMSTELDEDLELEKRILQRRQGVQIPDKLMHALKRAEQREGEYIAMCQEILDKVPSPSSPPSLVSVFLSHHILLSLRPPGFGI